MPAASKQASKKNHNQHIHTKLTRLNPKGNTKVTWYLSAP